MIKSFVNNRLGVTSAAPNDDIGSCAARTVLRAVKKGSSNHVAM